MVKAHHPSTSAGVTLDAGALIAFEKGDRRMIALLQQVVAQGVMIRIPVGVVGQTWRDGRRQAMLARLLRTPEVDVLPLDIQLGRACGELCGASGTNDVIDASVVITAKQHGDVIVTSDPDDLRRLDSRANVVQI